MNPTMQISSALPVRQPSQSTAAPAAATTPAPAPAAVAAADQAAVMRAVAAVQKAIGPVSNALEFNVDTVSGRTIVRVLDMETRQLIRQIPSVEMVQIAEVLERLEGLLLNHHA